MLIPDCIRMDLAEIAQKRADQLEGDLEVLIVNTDADPRWKASVSADFNKRIAALKKLAKECEE